MSAAVAATASRISQHHHLSSHVVGLGFYSRKLQIPSFKEKPTSSRSILSPSQHRLRLHRMVASSITDSRPPVGCFQPKSPREIPINCEVISQQEDDQGLPSDGLSTVTGGIVALGKFDALHIGHRELVIQASKIGVPFLLSLVGIAEILGWEPRAPIVAKCDRKRILSSWAPNCGNVVPEEYELEFSSIRHLTPRQFVEKLSKQLGVRGVVAGENYRFGYKAAGDASELVKLCVEYDLGAYIINSVMDKNQDSGNVGSFSSKERGQVSSTRVRHALAKGDMKYVSELLGRQHRLMLNLKGEEGYTVGKHGFSAPKSCLLNLAPKDGRYETCSLLIGENVMPCGVLIDQSHIHLELDDLGTCNPITSQDFSPLGIEFGDSGY